MRTVQSAHERRPYRDFDSANRYPDRFRARTLKAEQAMRNRNSTLMRNAAHSGAALLTSSPNAGLSVLPGMRTAATPNCQVSYSQIDQFMINPSLKAGTPRTESF
jgi:hypothetical protein